MSTGAHVVVINDDPVQLRQITALLGAADHEATGFLDASDALAKLSGALDVDLFVVDLHMPGIDGWKLCRLLRSPEFERFNGTPILVISATFTGDDVASITRELGANAFLEVPFEGPTLIAYVESLLLGEIPSEPSWTLIVEDDDAVRRTLGRAFKAHGYRVEEAATLAEARRKRAERQFDLVLLDYYLPDGPSEGALEDLSGPTHSTTTLVMTGDTDPMLPVRLMGMGADGYLRKPFDPAFAVELARKARRQRSLLRIETILEARTRELRASEGRYRTLFETIPDVVIVLDEHERVAEINPDGLRLVRCEADEVLGRRLVEFADPPGVKALSRWLDAVEVGGVSSLETDLVEKSGTAFPVELTGRRIEYHGAPAILVVGRDLTERRRNEEEQRTLERQMQHAQRLESLGVLAGGVAHDFNNLLVGILGNASLALMDLSGDSPLREAIDQIELAARRAAELTQQILAFAGKGRTETQEMDLSGLVREMGQLVEPAVSKKARVTYELPDSLPAVKGDPGQIRQVAMNLIINASDSLSGNAGTISVRTSMQEVPPTGGPEIVGGGRLEPGRYVALRVKDDGCGMDANTQARIFEPFFTTKFTGRGLGLAATLGIVRSHGGGIEVASELGEGTTITVLLPPSESVVPDADGGERPRGPTWTGGGTVLVVDDEPSVRKLARAALSRNSFAVVEARNGAEGVVMALDPAGEVDLVILDLTMPEMDGREALAVIRERRPDLPVLLSSGYPQEEIVLERTPGEPTEFLKKPYGPSELLDAVSALLAARAAARTSKRRVVGAGVWPEERNRATSGVTLYLDRVTTLRTPGPGNMRKLTYLVRASVDGMIAGPDGELDWLFASKERELAEFFRETDAVLLGTATYDYMLAQGMEAYPGMTNYVFSRTLRPEDHPAVTIVPTDPLPFVTGLKQHEGGGIWLLGGGVVFRYLLAAGVVDEIVVLLHPLLLGGGVPLLPRCDTVTPLELLETTPLASGLVRLRYVVGEPRMRES